MTPFPQAGELWYLRCNPSLMVLVLRIAESRELVLTKNLFNSHSAEGYRGIDTFRSLWKPVSQESK
jgi:hypothetical protein